MPDVERTPMDALLDRVDWTCTCCGVKKTIGCCCWEKDKRCPKGCGRCHAHCKHSKKRKR